MKTVVLFTVILMGYFLSVGAQNPGSDEPIPAITDAEKPNASAADVSVHVNDFINANPDLVSVAPPVASLEPGSMNTKCQCAVFNTETPTEVDNPILTQAPMSVSCDAAGEENCKKLCAALAEAAKERGPQLLCSSLGHYNNLKASVHSRACDAKAWNYTGLTAPTEICCHERQVIDCKDQVAAPPENQL